jgi:hypothetical protein
MSTTTTFVERRKLQDRRINGERRNNFIGKQAKHGRQMQIFQWASSFLVILTGVAGYWIAGLS